MFTSSGYIDVWLCLAWVCNFGFGTWLPRFIVEQLLLPQNPPRTCAAALRADLVADPTLSHHMPITAAISCSRLKVTYLGCSLHRYVKISLYLIVWLYNGIFRYACWHTYSCCCLHHQRVHTLQQHLLILSVVSWAQHMGCRGGNFHRIPFLSENHFYLKLLQQFDQLKCLYWKVRISW